MLELWNRRSDNAQPPGLWRSVDFLRLWSADLVSQFGTQISFIAIPLIATTILDASPFQISLLAALEWLPVALFSLPAGAWVDRFSRRPILICADIASAVTMVAIPVAYLLESLTMWLLYLVAIVTGTLWVAFDIAHRSYLPTVIGREYLVAGNGALEIGRSTARIAGPSLAGGLIGLLTAPVAIALDALSFIGSAFLLRRIHKSEPEHGLKAAGDHASERLRNQIGEGLRYVTRHRLLAPLAVSTSLSNLGVSIMQALLVVYMARELDLSAGEIGITFTVANVGLLAAASTASPIVKRVGLGRTLVASSALQGIGLLLVPVAVFSPMPILIASQLVRTFGVVVLNVNQRSLQQAIVPERLQGRANATFRFIGMGTIPIGNLLGGALATWVGFQIALWIGGMFAAAACIVLASSAIHPLKQLPASVESAS